jgi:hypothetical protein
MSLSTAAQMWMATGERCRSSETLFTYLSGVDVLGDHGDTFPMTLSDFRRCRLLLEECPELWEKRKRLGFVCKEWAELVSFWDDLCMMHDLESPEWRSKSTAARRTKKMLVTILTRVNPDLFQESI